jgi:hypothetical protein
MPRWRPARPARLRTINPYAEVALVDVVVKIEIGNPGLDDRKMTTVVNFDDAIHSLEVDDHDPL